jgi:hypothetical protein
VLNAADTFLAADIVTVQLLDVPEQAPLQPLNVEPLAGVALRVTAVPLAKLAEQVVPQLIPVGWLVTAPVPVPDFVTDSVYCSVEGQALIARSYLPSDP